MNLKHKVVEFIGQFRVKSREKSHSSTGSEEALACIDTLTRVLGKDVGFVDIHIVKESAKYDGITIGMSASRERDGLTFNNEYMSVEEFATVLADLSSPDGVKSADKRATLESKAIASVGGFLLVS